MVSPVGIFYRPGNSGYSVILGVFSVGIGSYARFPPFGTIHGLTGLSSIATRVYVPAVL